MGPGLRIGLQPHIRLIELRYPVDDLRVKVNAASEEHGTASNAVLKRKTGGLVRRIHRMTPEHIFLAVHRLDFMVYYRRLEAEEFRLLAALGHGLPVGKAMEAALEDSPVPVEELRRRVETWFAAWARNGLVMPAILTKLYDLLIAAACSLQSPFLLVVRLYWGFQMMQTGWGKLHNLAKVTDFFTSLGIPLPGLTTPLPSSAWSSWAAS